MRFVVCFLGLIASSLTAAIGAGFILWDAFLGFLIEVLGQDTLQSAGADATVSLTGISHPNAALVILLAAAYGFLGSFFVLFRCGKQGGALLLVPALFAAFVNPFSLAVTWFAILVGLLAMFVGPLPLNPPQEQDGDEDEEEEMPKPKGKVKPPKFEDDAEDEEEMPKPKPKAKGKPKRVVEDED
jgi:hypothetical protein